MKKLRLFIFLPLVMICLSNHASTNADTLIIVAGAEHPLRVSIPSDYNPEISYPLIVGLHYCGGTSNQYRNALLPLVDSLDVIVVCPDNNSQQITNTGFIIAAIDTAKSIYNINSEAVYLTGMSCNGFTTLDMGLDGIYPFKGIFPWDPYFSSFSSTTFNLDSEIPVVLSVGTSDENFRTILKLYDSLDAHQSEVNLVIAQGIGHTLDFAGFSNEMIRCIYYLNDANTIIIEDIEDLGLMDTSAMKEIKVKVTLEEGKTYNLRALSSSTAIIPNPEAELSESGDSIILKITPVVNKSGTVYVILEVSEENGTAIEQQVFKIVVEKHVSGLKTGTVDEVDIFPNPANDFINIYSTEQFLSISIFDINGKMILNEDKFEAKKPLDISQITSGIYFLKASGNNVNVAKKIIVN